jgi:hypothetical protein
MLAAKPTAKNEKLNNFKFITHRWKAWKSRTPRAGENDPLAA